jgi:hypothetical protein
MKNIKEITLLVFAIIGFYAVVTGFTKEEQTTTPESHVWEFHLAAPSEAADNSAWYSGFAFSINKVTGEVRQHQTLYTHQLGKNNEQYFATYRVSSVK